MRGYASGSKHTVCKTVAFRLRWFESTSTHQISSPSPNGRGKGLKILTVSVRIRGGAPSWCSPNGRGSSFKYYKVVVRIHPPAPRKDGRVWLMAIVLKTIRCKSLQGSNPCPSSKIRKINSDRLKNCKNCEVYPLRCNTVVFLQNKKLANFKRIIYIIYRK